MRELESPQALLRTARRSRGQPNETRDRLVAAAAMIFNRDGHAGADAATIAAAAGYSVGAFYKHFPDKQAALIAAYERWVASEWRGIRAVLEEEGQARATARAVVRLVLAAHLRWRGLRAAFFGQLHEPSIRKVYLRQRSIQLSVLEDLRSRRGSRGRSKEDDAVLILLMERTCDAIAAGDLRDLNLRRKRVISALELAVASALA